MLYILQGCRQTDTAASDQRFNAFELHELDRKVGFNSGVLNPSNQEDAKTGNPAERTETRNGQRPGTQQNGQRPGTDRVYKSYP